MIKRDGLMLTKESREELVLLMLDFFEVNGYVPGDSVIGCYDFLHHMMVSNDVPFEQAMDEASYAFGSLPKSGY
jgi:hypothetical protein